MADREAGAGRELAGHGSRVEGREAIGTCEAQGKTGLPEPRKRCSGGCVEMD